jgi:hypothetical protein
MKNKELVLRRIQTLQGRLKQLKNAAGFQNVDEVNRILIEMNDLVEESDTSRFWIRGRQSEV